MSVALRREPTSDPAAFVAAARDAVAAGTSIHLRIKQAECEVSGDLAAAVMAVLEAVSAGGNVDITGLPAELTTGQAADLLGVSRPTVVDLIDKGVLPATRIGTHRRLKLEDVLSHLDKARQDRHAALEELVEISDELGLYN
ncbi:MAG: helix-turn-helix domain-containing protein [Actinomycetota bacterium]